MYEKNPKNISPVYNPCKSDKLSTSDNFTCTILTKRDYVVVIYNVTKHAAHKGLNIEKHTSIECSLMLIFSSLIVTELLIHLRSWGGRYEVYLAIVPNILSVLYFPVKPVGVFLDLF